MKIQVQQGDGATEELELDLSLDNLTMREAVRLEEALGSELWDRLIAGSMEDRELFRPSVIQAILYAKLKTSRPELELDQFDVDLSALMEGLGVSEEAEIPKVEEGSSV